MSKKDEKDLDAARARSVDGDVAARGITDERGLSAMRSVHRERFVPAELAESAYYDSALPIGSGQTISQPYIVALMAEAAEIPVTQVVGINDDNIRRLDICGTDFVACDKK